MPHASLPPSSPSVRTSRFSTALFHQSTDLYVLHAEQTFLFFALKFKIRLAMTSAPSHRRSLRRSANFSLVASELSPCCVQWSVSSSFA